VQVIWFAIGAFVGSFLNVCIWRLPREESVVRPRSHCPACEHPIAWYDNVPLLSYAALGGRCRHCRAAIHWRYPVVEALSGVAAVAVIARFGAGLQGAIYLAFVWALIAASFIDLEHQIIPDEISVGGLVVGLAASLAVPQLHGTDQALVAARGSLVGAVAGGGLLYATGLVGNLWLWGVRRLGVCLRRQPFWRSRLARYRHMKEAMGGGDVKLLAMAGSLLGWKLAALAFFVAPLIAVVPGLVVLSLRRSHVIPYGPFLSAALVLSLFSGHQLIRMSGIEDTVQMLWSYYWGGS
jgi:leader peptidase (prepilin peptidase)/N-methyltransferase